MNWVDGKSQPCLYQIFAHINFSHLSPSSSDRSKLQNNTREDKTTRSISIFDNSYPSYVRANHMRAHESWQQMINSLFTVNPLLHAISLRRTGSAHRKISQLVSRCFKRHSIHQILMYRLARICTHHTNIFWARYGARPRKIPSTYSGQMWLVSWISSRWG